MRSFHYPDLHSTDLSIHRSQISALSAGKATTTVDCEVFLPNSKTSGKTKMAAFSRIKKVWGGGGGSSLQVPEAITYRGAEHLYMFTCLRGYFRPKPWPPRCDYGECRFV